MLHILWMILKFILIVIGFLLGLLVLALLLILFCPVRYSAQASGSLEEWKNVRADICISWLFRGIRLNLRLENGKTGHSIRILGLPLEKLLRRIKSAGKKSSGRKKQEKKEAPTPAGEPAKKQTEQNISKEKPVSDSPEKSTVREQQRLDETHTGSNKMPEETQDIPEHKTETADHGPEKSALAETTGQTSAEKTQMPKKPDRPGIFQRIRNKLSAFLDKLRKIPESIGKFASKAQDIYDKIDYWKQFLTHPRVKEAASFVWMHVKRLLKHIFPTNLQGHVTFGCEDPSVTGTVLAVLGITMPFHKNCIEINPVFDGASCLEGDVKLRGRIYGIVFVKTAVQIYFHKNIKYVINRWKHKEESL